MTSDAATPAELSAHAGETLDGLRFITSGVSAEEVAAVHAVLASVLHEESDLARTDPDPGTDAWARSQRAMRGTHTPGAGRWRGFEG